MGAGSGPEDRRGRFLADARSERGGNGQTAAEHLESDLASALKHGGVGGGVVRAHALPFLAPCMSHCVHHQGKVWLGCSVTAGPMGDELPLGSGPWEAHRLLVPADRGAPGVVQPHLCSWDGPWDTVGELGGVTVHSGPGSLLAGRPLRVGPGPSGHCNTQQRWKWSG